MFDWSTKDRSYVSISPSLVVFTTAFLGLLYFLVQIRNILTIFFLAFILMVALHPTVNKFQNKLKMPRAIAIFLVYLLFLALIFLTTALVLPPLASEIIKLIKATQLPSLQQIYLPLQFSEISVQDVGSLANQLGSSISFLVSAITGTFSGIFTFVTLIIMSIYLIIDRPHLYKKISWFTKNKTYITRAEKLVDSLEEQLGGWVRAEIILMSSIAIMTYFGLTLLKVPFALPLAIIAGFMEILPNLGPTISSIPAIIIAYLVAGPGMAGATIILYIVVQQLENTILVPKVMHQNAHVNPLVSMIAVLSGFQIGGVVGALLAIPFYIVLRALYSQWRETHP